MMSRFKFLIVGGGTGGICSAARLGKKFPNEQVAVIEPGEFHYYQPLWTLVGAGLVDKETTRKPMGDVMPAGVTWIKNKVVELLPDQNAVKLASNETVHYDYLILSPGLKVDFEKIKGVVGNLGKNGLCSIYDFEQSGKTFEMIQNFKGGSAIFTIPPMPIKCAGAPQKIMYLTEEILRLNGIRDKSEVHYYATGPAIFGIPTFAKALSKVVESRDIKTHFLEKLVEVRAEEKIAVFEKVAPPPAPVAPGCAPTPQPADPHLGERIEVKYDLLHVVPPNSPPEFVSNSPLAVSEGPQKGWMQVDQFTLQSPKYANVFGIGDVTGIPNAKTGAAIRKQVPIMIANLVAVVEGRTPQMKYDGYSSCPLVTSRSSVILAEFGYDGKLLPSFPIDATKERYSFWILKRYLLPKMYWWGMLKGWL
ncbi:MAG: FAD-dependent oxidoreductase [Pseudobdellovibrionaceae bacterium]